MRIVIAGSTGLIGTALVAHWRAAGHKILRLVRPETPHVDDGTQAISWSPAYWSPGDENEEELPEHLEGVDAVVSLAGENLATGRWTTAKKQRILKSRIFPTRLLAVTLAKLTRPPSFFFSASAVGYYPSSGDSILTEENRPGEGFLPEVCVEWEAETRPAAARGIRTVISRTGVVLAKHDGALAKQLPLFKWGLAGRLGPGTQYVPWIALDDVVRAVDFCLTTDSLRGPVNLTAPEPVTNLEFTKTLGKVLHRPTFLPAPAFALRLALGEMADALLASLRVVPQKLQQHGFTFSYPTLESALRHVLAR